MTPVGRMAIAVIRFYQRAVSPLLPPSCRFYPSCSQYALEAVQTHGAIRGTGYAIWRLLKCGPWNPGGYDPVRPRRTTTDERIRENGES